MKKADFHGPMAKLIHTKIGNVVKAKTEFSVGLILYGSRHPDTSSVWANMHSERAKPSPQRVTLTLRSLGANLIIVAPYTPVGFILAFGIFLDHKNNMYGSLVDVRGRRKLAIRPRFCRIVKNTCTASSTQRNVNQKVFYVFYTMPYRYSLIKANIFIVSLHIQSIVNIQDL